MFQRLYEFSRCLPAKAAWERLNEGMPSNYDRGIAICFDQDGHWSGIEVRHGYQGVIYRSGPSNGTDFTPCNKLAKSTANRLLKGVKAFSESSDLEASKRQWLQQTQQSYERNIDRIWEVIEEKTQEAGVDKDHRGYVFWARNGINDPVYAWPESKKFLVCQFLKPFAKGGVRTGTCSVCGESEKPVYGNFSVVACYNLDKKGSIAGGFQEHQAHRNLPVCGDCSMALAEAFNFGEQYFSSFMAGQTYMVFPYTANREIQEELADELQQHPQRFALGKARDLIAEEISLFEEFKSRGDQLALYLIFFKADNASWRIRAEVQQILPSRMQTLHTATVRIAAAKDLINESKTEEKPTQISAGTFKNFTGYGEGDSGDTLRTWLVALFDNRAIDYGQFVHLLVTRIIATARKNPKLIGWITRQAWGLYRYALMTNLIQPPITTQETDVQDATPSSAYGRYIEDHRDFFRQPELVVAFLTGCYVSQVASAQKEARGATPFTKKFMGRLLNQKALQRLYREGHGKLAQYDKLGYVITGLDPDLAAAWISCGDRWSIDDEHSTFAFTIGYSLAYRIRKLDSANTKNQETEA